MRKIIALIAAAFLTACPDPCPPAARDVCECLEAARCSLLTYDECVYMYENDGVIATQRGCISNCQEEHDRARDACDQDD